MGPYDRLFDLNRDGKLDGAEMANMFDFYDRMNKEGIYKENPDPFEDDIDGIEDDFDEIDDEFCDEDNEWDDENDFDAFDE